MIESVTNGSGREGLRRAVDFLRAAPLFRGVLLRVDVFFRALFLPRDVFFRELFLLRDVFFRALFLPRDVFFRELFLLRDVFFRALFLLRDVFFLAAIPPTPLTVSRAHYTRHQRLRYPEPLGRPYQAKAGRPERSWAPAAGSLKTRGPLQ